MRHHLDQPVGDGSDGSPLSEAWLFARQLLGNPVPNPASAAANARAERERLEWLASFSTDHADALRRLESAEAEARRLRKQLEWLASISTEHEAQLRRLLAAEARQRDAFERWERFEESIIVQEAGWDPAKHPRAPMGQPDGGQWVSKGGGGQAGGVATTGTPIHTASYAGPKRIDAQLISWHPPVGHHWVPVGVTQHPDIRPHLSDEAAEYAAGRYSGPTDPHHGNKTLDEVTHHRYNAEVKAELQKFIKQNKIKKLTAAQMEEFASLMEKGLGADGKPHDFIGRYNRAIKGVLPKATVRPRKLDHILAAGRKYMKHSRFRLLAVGAVISGILGEVVAQQLKVLNVASSSGLYRQALRALQDGDLSKARNLLIGDHDSLYHEILEQVGATAALDFKTAIERVFANARNREYK